MKKLLLVMCFLLTGCAAEETTVNKVDNGLEIAIKGTSSSFKVYPFKIEECDYLAYVSGQTVKSFVHKGNCKACIARNK